MTPRLLRGLLIALLGYGAPGVARADEGRILLVSVPESEGGWAPAEKRALAELAALGLDVQLSSTPSLNDCNDGRATRDEIRAAGALGALELRRQGTSSKELRVCVVDLVTGKATLRHVEIAKDLPPAQAALLAVELVHASLLEVRAPHPSRGQVSAPAQVTKSVERELAAPRAPWLGLRLGAGVVGGPGGVSVNVSPNVGIAILPAPRWAVDGEASVGALPGGAAREAGDAAVRLGIARLHAAYALRATEPFRLTFGLGGGIALASVTGEANAPYNSSKGVATTGLVSAMLTGSFRLAASLRLRVDSHLAWSPSPLRVTFANQGVAELGRPLVDAALAVEWLALR